MNQELRHYSDVLGQMARSRAINQAGRTSSLRQLLQLVASTIRADRVCFWKMQPDRNAMVLEMGYDTRTNIWLEGDIHQADNLGAFYDRLEKLRVIAVDDVRSAAGVSDEWKTRSKHTGLFTWITASVYFDGKMIGNLCCEMFNRPRNWTEGDHYFIQGSSDFLGRALEAGQRFEYEQHYKGQLMAESISANRQLTQAMLMAMPLPVALVDREFRYLAISHEWKRLYRFNVDNPIGRRMDEVQEYYNPVWFARLERALAGETLSMSEECIELPTGPRWISWKLVPWRSLEGEIVGVVVACDDITERKENESLVRQATKLTALGEMAGGIAHEINNPLSILKGFLDLMRRQIERGQLDLNTFQSYMERSHSMVDRISRIVHGMRRIARDSSADVMQDYSINLLINDALDFVQERIRQHGIELEIRFLEQDAKVLCRPVEVSQVLLNLLTNAFQAVESTAHPWIHVTCFGTPKSVRIQVEDSGVGVRDSLQEKIFQPFFTTKDIGKGMGLGLSISRRIMENHGGKLFLDSNRTNTCFVMELPLGTT